MRSEGSCSTYVAAATGATDPAAGLPRYDPSRSHTIAPRDPKRAGLDWTTITTPRAADGPPTAPTCDLCGQETPDGEDLCARCSPVTAPTTPDPWPVRKRARRVTRRVVDVDLPPDDDGQTPPPDPEPVPPRPLVDYLTTLRRRLLEEVAAAQAPASASAAERQPPPSHLDLDQAQRLLAEGLTLPKIADQLGCPVVTLRRHLHRAGVTIPDGRAHNRPARPARRPVTWTPDALTALGEEIRPQYDAGDSARAIARRLGHSDHTITRALLMAGATLRGGGR